MPAPFITRRDRLIRSVWLVYLALAVALFVVGLPLAFTQMQVPCAAENCVAQLTTEQMRSLVASGLRVTVFAGYLLAVSLIVPIIGLTLATVLIWRKPTDRMALCIALFFGTCTINITGVPATLAAQYPVLALPLRLFFVSAYGFVPLFTIFPDGRFVPRWARWLALGQLALAVTV